jgi:tRNA G18 (ribose-2'-O)-methylase SpoU
MPPATFEIRECVNCGLRYPLTAGSSFGTRCPACLGDTKTISTHPIQTENPVPFSGPAFHLEALLDNVRSAWNVGSIFRTADGFGLKHLHLCGLTPTPEIEAVRKTALGAEKAVAWTYHKNAVAAARELKAQGFRLFALEEDKRAVPIREAKQKTQNGAAILVVGNEITGVDPDLLGLCDEIFHIPMRGRKKSFNVAVAFAIAAFTLTTT